MPSVTQPPPYTTIFSGGLLHLVPAGSSNLTCNGIGELIGERHRGSVRGVGKDSVRSLETSLSGNFPNAGPQTAQCEKPVWGF